MFNLILAVFDAMTLLYGNPQDALFLGIIIANAGIGITQEVRARERVRRGVAQPATRPVIVVPRQAKSAGTARQA